MAESRDRGARLPDPVGVLLLGVGVALVARGIVGGETSWTAPATLARLGGGLGLLAVFAWRSARVATPLVEPALFRVRAFRAAVVGYLVFSAAFYALLLANVLFLTGVWHYAVLTAGLAVTPGPLCAATASAVGGRLADRFGARAVLVPGALLFAAGCALFAAGMGRDPAYLTHFLPATLLTGTGVGAVFSGLGVATVAALPPNRYATGSAVGTCARQIGAVFGISRAALRPGRGWGLPHGVGAHGPRRAGDGGRRRHRRPGARRPGPRSRDDRRDRMTTQLTRERTHSWTDPAETAAAALAVDGLTFLRALAAGDIPPAPIATTLGMTLEEVDEGRVVFGLAPAEFHYNPIGSVHGGVYATVLDSACGCAVHSTLPAGARYTSLDLTVKFLRGLDVAVGPVRCEGRVCTAAAARPWPRPASPTPRAGCTRTRRAPAWCCANPDLSGRRRPPPPARTGRRAAASPP